MKRRRRPKHYVIGVYLLLIAMGFSRCGGENPISPGKWIKDNPVKSAIIGGLLVWLLTKDGGGGGGTKFDDYFPLREGNWWSYTATVNGTPQTLTASVTGTKLINGVTTFEYTEVVSTTTTKAYYTSDSTGVKQHGEDMGAGFTAYPTPAVFLQYPMQVGKKWGSSVV